MLSPISLYVPGIACVAAVEEELLRRDDILRFLLDNLELAKSRMKKFADRHRSEKVFSVGTWVLLHLQPCRQASVATWHPQKLSPRIYGPYQILEKVGSVAYRLRLPPAAKIHPVFHVSQLREYKGDTTKVDDAIPVLWEEQVLETDKILFERLFRLYL